jgi:NADH-quinone oxidoreductase subunit M
MIQRVFFGKLTNDKNKKLSDLSYREIGLLAPLLFLMVFMGVYPRPFLDAAKDSVNAIQKRVMHQAGGDVDHAERNADFSPQAVSKEAN